MKIRRYVLIALMLTGGGLALAEDRSLTTEERLQSLEQRQMILERKYDMGREAATHKTKETVVTLSGLIQADHRDYLGDSAFADQFLVRRVRPSVEGTLNSVIDFRITPEFASAFTLLDAYGEFKYQPWLKLRAGKFKPPLGLEHLQSNAHTSFVELGYPAALGPSRDTGLQLGGDAAGGAFAYQLAVLNGVVDGGTGETDSNDEKDYMARIFLQPFKAAARDWLSGLGLGVAGSIGDQTGSVATANLPTFRSQGQQTFFSYAAGTFADGDRKRLVPQAHWHIGPLGLLGEYALSSQEVTRVNVSTTHATIDNRAYQVAVTWVLTGERASYKAVTPRKPFDPASGGWGALELAGRYTELKVDDEAFGDHASLATSAKRAKSWTGGFNWYLNANAKVVSNYTHTTFEGGAAGGVNRPHERVILSRLQFTY